MLYCTGYFTGLTTDTPAYINLHLFQKPHLPLGEIENLLVQIRPFRPKFLLILCLIIEVQLITTVNKSKTPV